MEYWKNGVLEYWSTGKKNTCESLGVRDESLRTRQRPLFIRIDFFDENCAAVRKHYMVGINAENCCPTY